MQRLVASTIAGQDPRSKSDGCRDSPRQRLRSFGDLRRPLQTSGSATFQHAIVEAAGGRDIFSDLAGSWPRVSAEEVIKRAPQVIMGADDHGDKLTVASHRPRPGWNLIPAVRSGRIILLQQALSPIPARVAMASCSRQGALPEVVPLKKNRSGDRVDGEHRARPPG